MHFCPHQGGSLGIMDRVLYKHVALFQELELTGRTMAFCSLDRPSEIFRIAL
jgi:hypothetical protein